MVPLHGHQCAAHAHAWSTGQIIPGPTQTRTCPYKGVSPFLTFAASKEDKDTATQWGRDLDPTSSFLLNWCRTNAPGLGSQAGKTPRLARYLKLAIGGWLVLQLIVECSALTFDWAGKHKVCSQHWILDGNSALRGPTCLCLLSFSGCSITLIPWKCMQLLRTVELSHGLAGMCMLVSRFANELVSSRTKEDFVFLRPVALATAALKMWTTPLTDTSKDSADQYR